MAGSIAPTSRNFFAAVLTKLGLPVTDSNLDALYSVEHLEGDNDRYNPLNVIQPEPGSTAFNSVGVQSYASFDTGVSGTAELLSNSHWEGVRAALARSQSVDDVLAAFQAAYTWDPGVQFPASTSIWSQEASHNVGPNAGSSSPLGQLVGVTPSATPADNFPGGGWDPLNWPGEVAGAAGNAVGSAAGGILKVVLPFLTKAAFLVGGLGLVVVGLYRASQGQREGGTPTLPPVVGDLAPAAAVA